MSEEQPQLPAPAPDAESRVDRIERIVNALSDFEQDELRAKLGALAMQQSASRMSDKRNLVALGIHTGLCCGVYFGFFMGIMAGLYHGIHAGVLAALGTFLSTFFVAGGLFGFFMGVFLALFMGVWVPRLSKNYSAQKSAMFQMESVDLEMETVSAFKVCKEVAVVKRGWKVELIDEKNLSIQMLTKLTVRSPGELVGIRVEAVPAGARVKIYSKALYTAMDFGKNRMNVTEMARAIRLNAETHRILALPGLESAAE